MTEARARLAALGEKNPPTTAGQLRELWPEIEGALARRHTLKAICECLEAGGIAVNPRTLAAYISRMRKSSARSRSTNATDRRLVSDRYSPAKTEPDQNPAVTQDKRQARDPLANVRQSEAKRPIFDYRPELADPKKLI